MPESVIERVLATFVKRFGHAKLVDIELVEETVPANFADLLPATRREPFRRVPLNAIPRNSPKLKLHIRIEEPKTGRELSVIATTRSQHGMIRRPTNYERPEPIETLPKEMTKRKVRSEALAKTLEYLIRIAQLIINLVNMLVNSGYIKHG
jgi:hypothetical protein